MEKKPSESFREYGFRWRKQAARVDPSMKESEMVDYFLQFLEPTYYGHLVSAIGKSFNEVVKMGGMVEEGLKSNKILRYSAIKATTQVIQNGIGGVIEKKKKEDVELIDTNRIEVQTPEAPNINQNPLPTYQETNMIEIVHKGGEPKKPSQTVMMIRSSEVKPIEKPTIERSVNKTNGEPFVVVKKGSPSDVAAKYEKSKVVLAGVANKPIVIVEGARTDPLIIKLVTLLPIVNSKAILWNYERVTVTYKGKEVKEEVNEAHGLTHSRRCFASEELRNAKTSKDNPVLVNKAVTEEMSEEFLRKMKVQDYSVVEQLRKMSAQISLLSLLIHSDENRRALMKIRNEAHVPDKISVNHLEKIANKIFELKRVTFSDDELPVEGTEHNRALYLTVKYEDFVVTRVLVDNGSSANIFPLSTLNNLKVLDVVVSYNLLLGRHWIHVAKAIPSTLHQMVKFKWDRQEIAMHCEDNLCAHSDVVVPFIRVEDDKGPWVYQVFETVSVEKITEGKCVLIPKGIIRPVSLPKNLGTFGLGFKPTAVDVKRYRNLKQRAWALPKPIPRLSRSFVNPDTRKRPVTTIPSLVVDIDEELIKRFERLFDDVNMVEVGEGSSKADVQFVGTSAKLNNWEATHLPTRKEFW
ncbi:uncharacterized protein [Nicotiana sylvestris]|uniref:uncharacterized protein n=1 Tax=Nicotiana sylvestris TaxID=4096 RepID=UPI00388C8CBB